MQRRRAWRAKVIASASRAGRQDAAPEIKGTIDAQVEPPPARPPERPKTKAAWMPPPQHSPASPEAMRKPAIPTSELHRTRRQDAAVGVGCRDDVGRAAGCSGGNASHASVLIDASRANGPQDAARGLRGTYACAGSAQPSTTPTPSVGAAFSPPPANCSISIIHVSRSKRSSSRISSAMSGSCSMQAVTRP